METEKQHIPPHSVRPQLHEPVLRPVGQSRPGLDTVRNCRVGFDGAAIVSTDRHGRRRKFPVGEDGIVRAVLVDAQGAEVGGRVGPPIPGGWGDLLFFDAADSLVVRLRLDHWVPEADRVTSRPVRGERLLARSGAGALLKKAGIPVTVTQEQHQYSGLSLRVPNALPTWYAALRGIAVAVWLVTLIVGMMLRPGAPWLMAVAAVAAVAGPAAYMVVRLTSRKQKTGLTGSVIAPAPAERSGATVRFCTMAAVYVEPRDLVLVDGVGRERRLARSGAHGVSRLVRRVDRKNHEPLGVELVGPDGQVRAALPWQWWFAGPGGEQRWQELRSASGLDSDDRALAKGELWPDDPVARVDAKLMGPLPEKSGRSASAFPESTLGGGNKWIMAMMGLFTFGAAFGSIDEPGLHVLVLALSALGFCGALLPTLTHELHGRLRLDRPAAGQETHT